MSFQLYSNLRLAYLTVFLLLLSTSLAEYVSKGDYLDLIKDSAPKDTWTLDAEKLPKPDWNLKQTDTNGKSLLGSLKAPKYDPFLPDRLGKRQTKAPWGNRTTSNSDPSSPPITGVQRVYNFTIARSTLAPDGVQRPVILINGQFPGPTIEANWGDTIVVNVQNNIENEGTSLHWHGLLQRNSDDQDGVPGVTQCPIAPGQSYTYSFVASSYGSSWYHAHYSAQYTAGLYGAMVIHGPNDNAPYDIDLGPVLLSDYYYQSYYETVQEVMGTDPKKITPHSDNNLINGKGSTNCENATAACTVNAGLAQFQFQTGKIHRLRVVNTGAEAIQKFSIDNHVLTVIAVDFTPIVPYDTTILTLAVGQRMDIVVKATGQPTDSVFMRSVISSCSLTKQPNAFALVFYPSADQSIAPTSTAQVDNTDPCAEEDLTKLVPAFQITPPSQPEQSREIDITISKNATGNYLWEINNSTFRADYNNPTLPAILSGQSVSSMGPEQNLYDFGSAKSIQLVINNISPVAHPMHLHGYDMSILAAGGSAPTSKQQISWDGSITNPQNPTRRDTFLLQPNGFMVVQINSNNPGVWPLHCHIAWHVSGGLYLNVVTQTPSILTNIKSSAAATSLCASWNVFSSGTYVDQIDSGL